MTTLLLLLLLQIQTLPPAPKKDAPLPRIVNTGCWLQAGAFTGCTLEVGTHLYASMDLDVLYLTADHDLTITKIEPFPVVPQGVGIEYGIYKDLLDLQQTEIDKGDSGALWGPGGGPFPPLTAGGHGFVVKRGHFVQLGVHALDAVGQTWPATLWRVTTISGAGGVEIARFPRHDFGMPCSGRDQWSSWEPWFNTSLKPWTVLGVTSFAVTAGPTLKPFVSAACLSIWTRQGVQRWNSCFPGGIAGLEKLGEHPLPVPQQVMPGEALVGHARNLCPVGQVWDHAIYTWLKR